MYICVYIIIYIYETAVSGGSSRTTSNKPIQAHVGHLLRRLRNCVTVGGRSADRRNKWWWWGQTKRNKFLGRALFSCLTKWVYETSDKQQAMLISINETN